MNNIEGVKKKRRIILYLLVLVMAIVVALTTSTYAYFRGTSASLYIVNQDY